MFWKVVALTVTVVRGFPSGNLFSICCQVLFPIMVFLVGIIPARMRILRVLLLLAPVYYIAALTVFIWFFRK